MGRRQIRLGSSPSFLRSRSGTTTRSVQWFKLFLCRKIGSLTFFCRVRVDSPSSEGTASVMPGVVAAWRPSGGARRGCISRWNDATPFRVQRMPKVSSVPNIPRCAFFLYLIPL